MTPKGERELNYIPESDLYRLIVHSKLPTAKAFEKWVFEEVLPQIRQTGGYGKTEEESLRAEVETMKAEIAQIKEAIEQPKLPQLPEPTKDTGDYYQKCKAYINASLDLCEHLFPDMARSQILHIGYVSLGNEGIDVEGLKRIYMKRHSVSHCTALDAVIEDSCALQSLIYCLCSNIVKELYDRRGKNAEDKR